MSTIGLFIIYSICIASASLLGGKLTALVQLTHTRTQLIMSFVAGLMLGVACYHLLPHAISTIGSAGAVDQAVWWLMVGLLLMFVLLRTFHFHQHEHAGEAEHDHGHHHDHSDDGHAHETAHSHQHDAATSKPARGAHPLSWVGVAAGLTLHTLIDGIALGAAIQADDTMSASGLISLGVFIAIVLHKPLDAMSITSLMHASHYSTRAIAVVNTGFSLMCPLGALLFFWGAGLMGAHQPMLVGSALAFSAGVFLCISLSDLLPEVQFHSHDSFKLTVALILGVALAYGIRYLEPEHVHEEHQQQSHWTVPAHPH